MNNCVFNTNGFCDSDEIEIIWDKYTELDCVTYVLAIEKLNK